jgi:hypothetical protein
MAVTPHLPSEIWRIIHRLATNIYAEGFYDPSPLPPLSESSDRSWDDHNWVSAVDAKKNPAISARRAFALVSRSWNEVAIPLLYEHVVIRSPEMLSSVVIPLSSGQSGEVGQEHLPTWHTKRLEILYTSSHPGSPLAPDPDETQIRNMSALLTSCPNLLILHFATGQDWSESSLSFQHCNLRHLRWNSNCSARPILKWLPSLPALQVLEIRNDSFSDLDEDDEDEEASDDGDDQVEISLPNLHTLVIADISSYDVSDVTSKWDLPCLTRLILPVVFSDPDKGYDILETFGDQLLSLGLRGSEYGDLADILSHCSSLVELSLSADWLDWSYLDKEPPSLTRISISLLVDAAQLASTTRILFDRCMEFLLDIRGPRLTTLRIIDIDNEKIQRLVHWEPKLRKLIKQWIEDWAKDGVEIQDGEGRSLSVRPEFQ